MKKVLFSLLLLLSCQLAFSQSASALFNDYKQERKATYVSVPRAMMSIAAGKLKDGNVQTLLQQVQSARVLTLSDCRKGVRKKFAKKMTQLGKYGYEEFTRVSDDRDNVLVMVKRNGTFIGEIAILMNSKDSCVGMLVTGHINPEDIDAVIGMVEE